MSFSRFAVIVRYVAFFGGLFKRREKETPDSRVDLRVIAQWDFAIYYKLCAIFRLVRFLNKKELLKATTIGRVVVVTCIKNFL